MNLVELIFYKKMQGVKRCPRADVVTAFDLDDLFTQFQPTATAAEEE